MALTEERIVSTTLSAGPAARVAEDVGGDRPKKSKLKLVIALVLVLAVGGGGVWFFVLRGPSTPKAPEKGAVMAVDPININLADGHYLKLGFALQLRKGAKADLDPSQALAIAIDQLSGQPMDKLARTPDRRKAVDTLKQAIEKAYGEDVIDLYPTTLVMQ